MATTFVDYTGDGNATKAFSFPSIQESDIKVDVDGDIKSSGTHYNITGYTTTGGGNVVFIDNSGSGGTNHIPQSPASIRIFRDTDVDNAKATYQAGSSVKAADLNANHEQLLFAAQEEQNQTIRTSNIKNAAVTTDKLADSSVTTAKIANSAITTAKINADAIDGTKIANDSINSEHYVDGSIDTAHIADSQITTAKIANSAVTNDKIADATIATAKYVTGSVSGNVLANGAVTEPKIQDGSITTAKLTSNAVTTIKIANGAVTNAKLASNIVTSSIIADNAVTTSKILNSAVTTDKIADDNVTRVKLVNDAVNEDKLADLAVRTEHLAGDAVTTAKIADSELKTLAGMQSATASKLADSTALTADIADLNQIDGMAKQTTITDDDTKFPTSGAVVDYVAAQLEPFGGFEAIANESSFPNTQPASGVAISIADAGGMTVSSSGTASGATVGGTTVNISGIPSNFFSSTVSAGVRFIVTSTGSGQNYTYHKATLKEDDLLNLSGDINDFSERYRVGSSNPTTSLDSGDLFFNTGTGKLLVYNGTNSAWEEAQSVGNFFINTLSSSSATGGGSATPNGTAYRFTLSNAGTTAQQHLVSVDGVIQKPNSGSSQPSEGFAISGSDIILGSAPVSGASIFIITIGSTVNIGTPSNNTVNSAILQNGSVTTAKLVDDSVTAAKLANTSVTAGSYGSATAIPAITVDAQGRITAASTNTVNTTTNLATTTATGSVTVTSSTGNNATISEATSSAAGVMSTAHHDKLDGIEASATADQTNSEIAAALSDQRPSMKGATFTDDGTGSPVVEIKADDANPWGLILGNTAYSTNQRGIKMLQEDGGHTKVRISGQGEYRLLNFEQDDGTSSRALMTLSEDGSVYLRHQGTIKCNTSSTGISVAGTVASDGLAVGDNEKATFGGSQDLEIYHNGTSSYIENDTGNLTVETTTGDLHLRTLGDDIHIRAADNVHIESQDGSEKYALFEKDGGVELYYDNILRAKTTSNGLEVHRNSDNTSATGDALLLVKNFSTQNAGDSLLRLLTSSTSSHSKLQFADPDDSDAGALDYDHANDRLNVRTGGTTRYSFNTDNFRPSAGNTYDLGTSSYRWRNIYTNDLNLSNEGSSNDVDGSWGDWTIQEGESDLFLKNNRSGKKYKFNLTEVS